LNIREIVEQTLTDTGSGFSADLCAKTMLCNLLDDAPFQAIELHSLDELLLMMKDADYPHVYGENSIFYFSAYFYHDNDYPVGRNYFMKVKNLIDIAKYHQFFRDHGMVLPIISPLEIKEKIRESGYKERLKKYKDNQITKTSFFRGLFEGRKQAINIDSSMYISSSGCLVCGKKPYNIMTSTFSSSKGFMFGFNLCEEHMNIAQNEQSLTHYLANIFQQPSPKSVIPLDTKSHFALVLSSVPRDLDCEIVDIKKDSYTLTMQRKTGFKIILRLNSPDNYAYMIQSPDGKELARIDSANHHKVNYGPDHVHIDTTKKKKKKLPVEASFTTGSPMIDTKKILELIELKEKS
jgi:hypothetical protein